MEAINWACARVQDNHDLVPEFFHVLHDNRILGVLSFDIHVPCVVQWMLLWFHVSYSGGCFGTLRPLVCTMTCCTVGHAGNVEQGH